MKWVCLTASLLLSSVSARAAVAFSPHLGYPAPQYFSGTNSRAFIAAAASTPHVHISKIELYLNGVLTSSDNYPMPEPGGEVDPIATASIMFDSHYFAYPLTTIDVVCKVTAVTTTGALEEFTGH